MHLMPMFKGMSCFEIAHDPFCKGLFVQIERNGTTYTRSVKKHPLPLMLAESYEKLYHQQQKEKANVGRPRKSNAQQVDTNNKNETTINDMDQQSPPVEEIQTTTLKRNNKRSRDDDEDYHGDDSVAGTYVSNITTHEIAPTQVASVSRRNTRSKAKMNSPEKKKQRKEPSRPLRRSTRRGANRK